MVLGQMATLVEESFVLTERQKEVLELVADGLQNEDIAKKLFITKHTVKAHIGALYEIFGVNCRVTLVSKALKVGLLNLYDIKT